MKRHKLSRRRICPLVFLFFTPCCYIDLLLVLDVKAKINSLRMYFSRELTKKSTTSRKSGSGRDEVFKSKWPYFQSLEFLRDSIAPRKTMSFGKLYYRSSRLQIFLKIGVPEGLQLY